MHQVRAQVQRPATSGFSATKKEKNKPFAGADPKRRECAYIYIYPSIHPLADRKPDCT